jgi:hypothetical protein
LIPHPESTITIGPSFRRSRSTVDFNDARVFFSACPCAYPALRAMCRESSETTTGAGASGTAAATRDAMSAAARLFPLAGWPQTRTRHDV